MNDYWIKNGKSQAYHLKEEITSWGGSFDWDKKMWKIHCTDPEQADYKSLVKLGLKLVPVVLTPDQQKINDILNNNNK